MSDFDRDIEHVMRGRLAARELQVIGPLLKELEDRIDHRVMLVLSSKGGLTEQQALQAWYEKAALHKLRVTLEQTVNAGKSAGARQAAVMTTKKEDIYGEA